MKVYAISDLHLTLSVDKPMEKFGDAWANQLEILSKSCNELLDDDDLLLIGGDISWAMREDEAIKDLEYIASLKGHKVLVRGNHDYWWSTIAKVRRILPPKVYAVHNDAIRFDGGFVIAGNRGVSTPEKPVPSLERERYELLYARELARFDISLCYMNELRREGDKTIFLTHYPPFNLAKDATEFTKRIENAGCDAVVYGHLHHKHLRLRENKDFLVTEMGSVKYYLTSSDILGHVPIRIF